MKQKKEEAVVVYIITKLELGGAQKVCLSLFQQVSPFYKTILISGSEGPLVEEVKNHNVLFLSSLKREISVLGILHEIKACYHIFRYLRGIKKKYQTVIVHTHSTKAGLIGRWMAWLARIPIRIHTVHGFGFHPFQNSFFWFINYFLELITSVITQHYICVSSVDIQQGTRLIPFFKSKTVLIRAATEMQQQSHKQYPVFYQKVFCFGTVACFKKQKNIFDLLESFELCYKTNNHIRLEIIGDGILRPAIEQWIKKNSLESAITLLGWQKNVSSFLSSWDCFVLSSLWEGLPCAIVEARLHKLPVIAYASGGIEDVIMHDKNGLLCKPRDMKTFAEYMLSISTNKTLHTQLSQFKDNLSEFSTQSMIDHHINLYNAATKKQFS